MEKNNRKQITFIFPTKNRPKEAIRFLEKNIKNLKKINPIFLIVVTDYTQMKIFKKKFNNKKYVKILIQKRKGFMNACFESIKQVKTKYCTFLYDDDKISQYSVNLYEEVFKNKFVFGYGILVNKNDKTPFQPITISKISNQQLISAYFGENISGIKFMPVSPICIAFPKKFLIKWEKIILKFCKNNNYRKEFLLEKNIGPDLILYLHQIIKIKKIVLAKPFIAKFVMHKNSMSYILGGNKLKIGYWLAKISLVEFNKIKNTKVNQLIFTFLVLAGYYLLFYNFYLKINKKKNYTNLIKTEIRKLKKNKNFDFSITYSIKILTNKLINNI